VAEGLAQRLPRDGRIGFIDDRSHGSACATALLVNVTEADRLRYKKNWLTDRNFTSKTHDKEGRWRVSPARTSQEIVCAWDYGCFALAGFQEVDRDRIAEIHHALMEGRLAVTHSSSNGPLLLLADRFAPEYPLRAIVGDVLWKRADVGGTGSAYLCPEIIIATRPEEVERAALKETPKRHPFILPDGAVVEVPRERDRSIVFSGDISIAGIDTPIEILSVEHEHYMSPAPGIPPADLRLGRAEDFIREASTGSAPARTLAVEIAAGRAAVVADELVLRCAEPVWRFVIRDGEILCILDLASSLSSAENFQVAIPAWQVDVARTVGTFIARTTGIPVRQIGRLRLSNPFAFHETVQSLTLPLMVRHAAKILEGLEFEGVDRAKELARKMAQGTRHSSANSNALIAAYHRVFLGATAANTVREGIAVLGGALLALKREL
jgi:hypothetical protein